MKTSCLLIYVATAIAIIIVQANFNYNFRCRAFPRNGRLLPVIGQPLLPSLNWSLLNHTAHPQQSQTGHSNIDNSVCSLDGTSSRVVIKQNSEASLFIGYIPIDYESKAAIGSYAWDDCRWNKPNENLIHIVFQGKFFFNNQKGFNP
ncbi:hypothetical protein PGTUg99_007760 [Puccinia graminis f. sp. tritici]|uniref:Uncharacterized protein n=1 Tax=Puccinia graminis f. sp. tritici TaxID=56615 RepID=A0A5B0LHL8_PUCGR|nr:hypothetical protein PGTUg99_007760 [Puccinia graminis f. sp. tritici]